ncbi:3'-5' exoribonuclease 1-like [Palaemon carinicauda]|uniref:3'-5' exoribonuclease 1-like n=1 Tax=Palaemon carinicauda TaxID=392227 RepID=UPI0035B69604
MEMQVKNVPVSENGHIDDLSIDALKFLRLSDTRNDESDSTAENHEEQQQEADLLCRNPYESLAYLEEETETVEIPEHEKETEETERKPSESSEKHKELSRINGQINRMRIEQLKKRLRQFCLDTSGTRSVLQQRLKAYYKRKVFKETECHYSYYVVIDFEATCDAHPHNIRHEIIEFPAVLVSTKKKKIVAKFHSYVRPVINPKLTTFCTNLTGITQEQVNFAPQFPEVLRKFEDWLKEHNLKTDMKTFAVVTDGPWDMGRFLYHQCNISKVSYPQWAKTWINIKKPFCNFYNTERMNLQGMLTKLGMTFIGHPHSGLDDARNIARVTLKLHEDGANMRVNEQISFKKPKSIEHRLHTVKGISRNSFNAMIKRRSVDPPRDGESEHVSDESEEEEDPFEDHEISCATGSAVCEAEYDKDFPSLQAKEPKILL